MAHSTFVQNLLTNNLGEVCEEPNLFTASAKRMYTPIEAQRYYDAYADGMSDMLYHKLYGVDLPTFGTDWSNTEDNNRRYGQRQEAADLEAVVNALKATRS